jgi:dextranase
VIVPLLWALDVGLSPVLPEQATFAPSQTPRLSTTVQTGSDAFAGTIRWQITHLGRVVDGPHVAPLDLEPQASVEMQFLPEQLPVGDRGFLCEVVLRDDQGVELDHATGAFEVAEDWTRFPRYGYLTQFNKPANAVGLLRPLRDGLINVVQVYDWMDEHHRPWRVGYDYWQDIAARDPWVSRTKLLELIDVGKDFGMASMAYNLMYGAYENYQGTSPIDPSWGMYRSGGVQDAHQLNIPEWETQSLALFDPGHEGWQDWIAARTAEAFEAMPFDGWHIDTLGDRGAVFDVGGQPIDLTASYTEFLTAMQAALPGQDFSVNAVGDFGGPALRDQDAWDVAYYELWNQPAQDDYADLRSFLSAHHSASDAAPVVAGYVNYDLAQQYSGQVPGQFNSASVLLAQSAVLANGGWLISRGDGSAMLCNEYFPNRNLQASADLLGDVDRFHHFAVAYENLLRDGVQSGSGSIAFGNDSVPTSNDGEAGAVWTFRTTREGDDCANRYDVVHLVDLRRASDPRWRDPAGVAQNKDVLLDQPIQIQFTAPWSESRLWFAAPEWQGGQAVILDATVSGNQVSATVPYLEHWGMVWIEYRTQPGTCGCPSDLNEDGFVGFLDVLEVVASWGPCLGCSADVNNDGAVEFADLLQVLADYGDCF